MDTDQLRFVRGPGDPRTRRYYTERDQGRINRTRAREAKRILEGLNPD